MFSPSIDILNSLCSSMNLRFHPFPSYNFFRISHAAFGVVDSIMCSFSAADRVSAMVAKVFCAFFSQACAAFSASGFTSSPLTTSHKSLAQHHPHRELPCPIVGAALQRLDFVGFFVRGGDT